MRDTPNFINPSIMDENGGVVWSGPELLVECEARTQGKGDAPEIEGDPSTDGKATFEDNGSG